MDAVSLPQYVLESSATVIFTVVGWSLAGHLLFWRWHSWRLRWWMYAYQKNRWFRICIGGYWMKRLRSMNWKTGSLTGWVFNKQSITWNKAALKWGEPFLEIVLLCDSNLPDSYGGASRPAKQTRDSFFLKRKTSPTSAIICGPSILPTPWNSITTGYVFVCKEEK